jgi:hypothetical protein
MAKNAFILIILFIAGYSAASASPAIDDIDRIRLAEAYRVGEKLQEQIWPGWSTAPFGILFVTDDDEFLIRQAKPNSEFVSIGYDKLLKSEVFVRPRKYPKSFLATFPAFDATPVIVIGKAENTSDKTSTRWLFVLLHEHFHQLQYSRHRYFDDVNGLNLAHGDTSGMWQINFPFPYKDPAVGGRFRQLADLLMSAGAASNKDDRQLAVGKYLAARRDFAASLSPDDYKYASFQLWQEGIARYTQYKIAKLAGKKMKPSKAFHSLKDFTPFDQEADRLLAVIHDEMKKMDLSTWERVVFYPFGASEGLLLDRVEPNWQQNYFSEKFALEKFYPATETK